MLVDYFVPNERFLDEAIGESHREQPQPEAEAMELNAWPKEEVGRAYQIMSADGRTNVLPHI